MEAHAELRLQVLQGSYKSNGCDTKNGYWKILDIELGLNMKDREVCS
jgi:hypothetical protein